MAIGRITGPMLFSNLERQGVDLAVDGNLIYTDVTNRRVGISTSTPGYSLDVPGNVRVANLVILGNVITSNTGKVGLGTVSNIVVTGGNAYDILYTDGTGNLAFGNLASLAGLETFTGNNIQLGANTAGYLVSNAVTLTTATSVTNAVAQLNFVLGKLVPPAPPTFPGGLTLALSTSVSSGRLTSFTQTDNSGWGNLSVAAGTSINATRVNTYNTNLITNVGPGDAGTVTAYFNGVAAGSTALTTGSQNGTYGNLVITSDQDYHNVVSTVTAGFWESFSAGLSGTSIPTGWNRANIAHSLGSPTNTFTWYYDSSTPGTPTFSNTSIALNSNTVSYSSTVPHFTSSANFIIKGNVARLSGDTYPSVVASGASTMVTGSSATGFQAPASVTYTSAGVTVPLARNLYVSSGSAYFETTAAIATGFGSTTTGPSLSVNNNYATGASGAIVVSGTPTILYKTGTSTAIEETSIAVTSVGVGSGNGSRIANPGSADNPVYTGSEATFNSTTGPFYTYDATNVGSSSGAGVIKFDQTNYSTGYLPVGPNLTGQGASQYFTFKFTRTTVQRFDVLYSGTIAGLWVALPGSAIDTTAAPTNGWLSMATAYAGSGVPGTGTGGNGSSGCAYGGVATIGSAVSNKSVTANFGTVQSGSSGTNAGDIYVRIKLTSGQSLTALSIVAATH